MAYLYRPRSWRSPAKVRKPHPDERNLRSSETYLGYAEEERLYQLVRQTGPVAERTFEIEFFDAGVRAYAFTSDRATGTLRHGTAERKGALLMKSAYVGLLAAAKPALPASMPGSKGIA